MEDEKASEMRVALTPPAISTNRFFLMANAERLRISFGEVAPDGVIYRSAITMSRANALALADHIQKLLKSDSEAPGATASGGGSMH